MKFAHGRQHVEPHRPRPRRIGDVLTPVNDVEVIPFDPHQDITESMKEDMLQRIRSIQRGELTTAARCLTVFPEMRSDSQMDTTERDRVLRMLKHPPDLSVQHNRDQYSMCFSDIVPLVTCYPEVRQQIPANLIEKRKAELNKALGQSVQVGHYEDAARFAVWLLHLEPGFSNELSSNDKLREGLLGEIKKYMKTSKHYYRAILNTRRFVLLFPNHRSELPLSSEWWGHLKSKLHTSKVLDVDTEIIEAMTIVAAQHAEIGQDGLIHITPRQSRLKKAVPVPDRPHV